MFPEDVVLAIFDYCAGQDGFYEEEIEEWQTLLHVCHRWRIIVLGSPRRLNLRLVCTPTTPARDRLDIWPPLPLFIRCHYTREETVENVLAVLEHSNRVYQISLVTLNFEKISAAMEVPFPELTDLMLLSEDKTEQVFPFPDSFLGGSAPRLRELYFHDISFPGLPNLLLSATHLTDLSLFNIPHSGYFSPEGIIAALSSLNSLGCLQLEFRSPLSRPHRRPPHTTRFAFPALTFFRFKGASEYLEDLVVRIDAPRLDKLRITFFNQIIFHTPQFIQFIGRTPTLEASEEARIIFEDGASRINFSSISSQTSDFGYSEVKIPCNELDWQVSSLEQVFTSCLPHLSTLEGLSIDAPRGWQPDWQDNVESTLWLDLLLPFTTVKNLYLCEVFARRIVPALEELVEDRRTEVLPALKNIFLEGLEPSEPVEKGIGQFVAMRQVTSHPVAVTRWDRSPP